MNRLRNLRGDISQQKIADNLGISQRAYSNYENGKREPDQAMLLKMAEYFNVSVDYLLGRDVVLDFFSIPNIEPLPGFKTVPLVGTIACGTPALAEENIEEYVKMSETIKADFALRCKGSSMINARIFDGDIVFIRQQPDVENGEIAAVLIENEATLKRVYKYPTRIELRAENPTFPALNYESEELDKIKILGKAVAFISTVR